MSPAIFILVFVVGGGVGGVVVMMAIVVSSANGVVISDIVVMIIVEGGNGGGVAVVDFLAVGVAISKIFVCNWHEKIVKLARRKYGPGKRSPQKILNKK